MSLTVISSSTKSILIVLFNGDPVREIHTGLFGMNPRLSLPDDKDWKRYLDTLEFNRAKSYLLRRLSRQNAHSVQASQWLKERLVQPEIVHQLLVEFEEKGFINDTEWIVHYLETHKKKYGIRKLLFELGRKGISVDPALIEDGLSDEKKAIAQILQKRYRSENFSDRKVREKIAASLARRGFSHEAISYSLSRLIYLPAIT
jgi:regulatory protein